MSRLTVYDEGAPAAPTHDTAEPAGIAAILADAGVRFEQWATIPLAPGAAPEQILAAYRPEIERLKAEGGYTTEDVARMGPDHPQREAIRQKFLAEHTHSEDEVRFFVEGAGLFCFHIDGRVYQLVAAAGDLVSVPAGTRHWFDTGAAPSFTAIRLFIDPAGWVANYTGADIATRFPTYTP